MQRERITLGDALRARPGLAQQVESQRDAVVQEIELATAEARWDYQQDDRGRDLLVLQIRDPLGAQAQTRFAPAEAANEQVLRRRLHDLLEAAIRINRWRNNLTILFRNVRGNVKQLVEFRNWVAHGHFLAKPAPLNAEPRTAHGHLTDFLRAANMVP